MARSVRRNSTPRTEDSSRLVRVLEEERRVGGVDAEKGAGAYADEPVAEAARVESRRSMEGRHDRVISQAVRDLGSISPEARRWPESHRMPVTIDGLPDLSASGRFLFWDHPVASEVIPREDMGSSEEVVVPFQPQVPDRSILVEGKRGKIESVDLKQTYDERIMTELKRVSPFHVRAWMGEFFYPGNDTVKVSSRGVDTSGELFPVPRQFVLQGKRYTFVDHIGGGLGVALVYEDESRKKIVMKVTPLELGNPERELRTLEETAMHAVIHSKRKEQGESISPIAKNIHAPEAATLSEVQMNHFVTFLDAVYLKPEGDSSRAIAEFFEFLPGGTLLDELRDDPKREALFENGDVKPEAMASVIADGIRIAEGLAILHEVGVVHRDMKPGNVVRGEDGQLRLIDFGIMKGAVVREGFELDVKTRFAHEKLTERAGAVFRVLDRYGSSSAEPGAKDGDAGEKKGSVFSQLAKGVRTLLQNSREMTERTSVDRSGFLPELSLEDQAELWTWLQDWQDYQYGPVAGVLTPKERLETLRRLLESFEDPKGVVGKFKPYLDRVERIEETYLMPKESALRYVPEAKMLEQDGAVLDVTSAKTLVGTPKYLAPEHTKAVLLWGGGDGLKICIDERGEVVMKKTRTNEMDLPYRADVFSLGCMLAEMVGVEAPGSRNMKQKLSSVLEERGRLPFGGLVLKEGEWIPESLRQEIEQAKDRVIPEALGQDGLLKEKVGIQRLLQEEGMPQLIGLMKWMTLVNPADRPGAKDVLFVLRKIHVFFGRQKEEEAAVGEVKERILKLVKTAS